MIFHICYENRISFKGATRANVISVPKKTQCQQISLHILHLAGEKMNIDHKSCMQKTRLRGLYPSFSIMICLQPSTSRPKEWIRDRLSRSKIGRVSQPLKMICLQPNTSRLSLPRSILDIHLIGPQSWVIFYYFLLLWQQ